MPRPFKNRCINANPAAVIYKPAGVPASSLKWVTLSLDEFEVIRLLDEQNLSQEQAAEKMNVSRPTVTRIYQSARSKMAYTLVHGCALCIEGGNIEYQEPQCNPCGRGRGRRGFRGGRNNNF